MTPPNNAVDETDTGFFSPVIAWMRSHTLHFHMLLAGTITAALCTIAIFTILGLLPLFLTLAARITSIGAIFVAAITVIALSGLIGFIIAKMFIFYTRPKGPVFYGYFSPPVWNRDTKQPVDDDPTAGCAFDPHRPLRCSIPDSPPIDVFKFVPHTFPDGITRQVVSFDGENPLVLRRQFCGENDYFMPRECLVNGRIPMEDYYLRTPAERVIIKPDWLMGDSAKPILKPKIKKGIAIKIMATLNSLTSKAESMGEKEGPEAKKKISEFQELKNLAILLDEISELSPRCNAIRRNVLELWEAEKKCILCQYINEGREDKVGDEQYYMFHFVYHFVRHMIHDFRAENHPHDRHSACPGRGESIQGKGPLTDITIAKNPSDLEGVVK
jgi:hypothetical protein